jgi:hypothetical protein
VKCCRLPVSSSGRLRISSFYEPSIHSVSHSEATNVYFLFPPHPFDRSTSTGQAFVLFLQLDVLNDPGQLLYRLAKASIRAEYLTHLFTGMDHGGMVFAAELCTDLFEG